MNSNDIINLILIHIAIINVVTFFVYGLDKLKAKKHPNEVERWNKRLIENLIEYNEPFTGLGSTDY